MVKSNAKTKSKIEKQEQVNDAYHSWMTEEMSGMKQVSLGIGNEIRCDDTHPSHATETEDTKSGNNNNNNSFI